jgi:hypothetical protein
VRTNFLLVYCADPAERARIAGQLNKGETLHALRRHLVIGSRTRIPADEDDHRRHALCLQLLVDAVQAWNARYMTAAIDHVPRNYARRRRRRDRSRARRTRRARARQLARPLRPAPPTATGGTPTTATTRRRRQRPPQPDPTARGQWPKN